MQTEMVVEFFGPGDVQREIEYFFQQVGQYRKPMFLFEKGWKPLCDLSETEGEVFVTVDLAGVSTDKITIQVGNSSLRISGIRREPGGGPRRRYHMMEISYGMFEREIRLPSRVDAAGAKAKYENGILEIIFPKSDRCQRGGDL